ncbi:MAG: LPP20 family lipoprotein [Treponema sp.]|nr:LPP20 family lipoprotein [Treponema sp.]
MKKLTILCVACAICLMGCASKKAADDVPSRVGKEGVQMPEWVMSGAQAEDGIYAVGAAKMSNRVNSITAARTNGRAELLRTVQSTLKSAITTYAEDTGVPSQTLNYMEAATVERTAGILQGSQQKDYWMDEDGTVYVLMYLPFKGLAVEANNIIDDYVTDAKTKITEEKVAAALKKYNLLNSAE